MSQKPGPDMHSVRQVLWSIMGIGQHTRSEAQSPSSAQPQTFPTS